MCLFIIYFKNKYKGDKVKYYGRKERNDNGLSWFE